MLAIVAVLGFLAGHFWSGDRPAPSASSEMVRAAQEASYWGLDPSWIDMSGDEAVFRGVRDRAYAFCLRDEAIDRTCAQEQDDAAHAAVLTLMLVADQRRMPDKSGLSERERRVAENPAIVMRARAYCWALYGSHGRSDARLLSTCLSNLTDGSQLVPMPVP